MEDKERAGKREREKAASGKDLLLPYTHYTSSTRQPLQIDVMSNLIDDGTE